MRGANDGGERRRGREGEAEMGNRVESNEGRERAMVKEKPERWI